MFGSGVPGRVGFADTPGTTGAETTGTDTTGDAATGGLADAPGYRDVGTAGEGTTGEGTMGGTTFEEADGATGITELYLVGIGAGTETTVLFDGVDGFGGTGVALPSS